MSWTSFAELVNNLRDGTYLESWLVLESTLGTWARQHQWICWELGDWKSWAILCNGNFHNQGLKTSRKEIKWCNTGVELIKAPASEFERNVNVQHNRVFFQIDSITIICGSQALILQLWAKWAQSGWEKDPIHLSVLMWATVAVGFSSLCLSSDEAHNKVLVN